MLTPGWASIFDMDGLLIDSEPLWHVAEVEIFGALGVPLQRTETRSTKGMFVQEVTRYWFERFPWQGPSTDEVAETILTRVAELVEDQGTPAPGAREVVAAMAERGPVALASSTPYALIDVVLTKIELSGAFKVICSAEDEAYGKPHPAVFLAAARALGQSPDRCVVFEDSPAGVLAAKAASMRCVAVPEPAERSTPQIQIADLVVSSLDVLDLVELDQLLASVP